MLFPVLHLIETPLSIHQIVRKDVRNLLVSFVFGHRPVLARILLSYYWPVSSLLVAICYCLYFWFGNVYSSDYCYFGFISLLSHCVSSLVRNDVVGTKLFAFVFRARGGSKGVQSVQMHRSENAKYKIQNGTSI